MIAFAPNGDAYIGEGHANESPNDTDSDDPANNLGAARIIHLDQNGRFINQWYGNEVGPGKFSSAHGLAVAPAQLMYVGDDPELDVEAARAAGLKTAWMNRRAHPWPAQYAPADLSVTSCTELADALQA